MKGPTAKILTLPTVSKPESLESGNIATCNDMLESERKVPYRRLEAAAQKFAKVVIPTDLERLRNHQINMEKQLRANMQDMEMLFVKVRKEDIQALTKVLQPVKDMALASINTFLEIHMKSVEDLREEVPSDVPSNLAAKESSCESNFKIQTDVQLVEIQNENASDSWNALEKDLLDLNEIINEFSHVVHTQQDKIDSIEDHVNTAAVNVEEGTKNLGKALKYKLSLLPAAGALLGGIVGGPIGLMAGFKVAGIATAIGGGLLGFTGGKVLQRKKENVGKEQISSIKYHQQEEKELT
ncbi:syntaxin-17 isoform X2 [Hyla sarda]|uniref:syntaxin-17 isoform X2 n=1 Tax=Hyla sarda TaxID=327740 RepID=UPI0024C41467|nr:syntaxin-17 isoform X2 [Hyla sarda]